MTFGKTRDTLASYEIEDVYINNSDIGLNEAERDFGITEMSDANDEEFKDFQTTN